MSALDGLVIKDMLIQHALSECVRLRREFTNLCISVFQIKGDVAYLAIAPWPVTAHSLPLNVSYSSTNVWAFC